MYLDILNTLWGHPISGLDPQRIFIISLIKCFCPLYVLKMVILFAG